MKNILGMSATLLSVALLTIYPNNLKAGEEQRPWHCKGKCRTWVVYKVEDEASHMAKDDKFQIRKFGSKVSFIALSDLKENWAKMDINHLEFDLTQTKPEKFSDDSRFCGFLEIGTDNHEGQDKGHMFKIKLLGNDTLQISWTKISSSSKAMLDVDGERKLACEALNDAHGGRIHAEPN